MRHRIECLARVVWPWLVVALAMATSALRAQTPPQAPTFKPEEIEALVAPVALYPDSLLSQVLMASTYPLEIVYATRWLKANPGVTGDSAVKAVEGQPWDASVKSLLAFPQVLEPMNDKLDWTQKLGDAFLAQEKDVLAAVQRLRTRAQQAGNLQSNEQQKVIIEAAPASAAAGEQTTIVRIEPANPQVIYVPTYNPTVVYGTWAYPYYPPYYWPPYTAYYPYYPGAAFASGLAWGIGFVAAGAIFGNCNWGGGDVDIDIDRVTNIDRNFDRSKIEGGKWKHDASHRQGVAYRDNATREKFGRNTPGAEGRGDFRGREGGAADRAGLADRAGGGGVADRQGAVGDRGGAGDRAGPAGDRGGFANPGAGGGQGAGGRDHAFQGVGSGGAAQRDFNRGQASNRASGAGFGGARPSGGFGGGGRPMGGGRGGGRR